MVDAGDQYARQATARGAVRDSSHQESVVRGEATCDAMHRAGFGGKDAKDVHHPAEPRISRPFGRTAGGAGATIWPIGQEIRAFDQARRRHWTILHGSRSKSSRALPPTVRGISMPSETESGTFDPSLNSDHGLAREESPEGGRADELFATTYRQLKQIAHRERTRDNHTLNTTGLVHEVFLKLRTGADPDFGGAPQFIAYAARAMRHILLDRAIRKSRTKFGGGVVHTDVADPAAQQAVVTDPSLALQLDSALCVLEQADARAARTFELHYFAGLELDKVAEILGVSKRTVDRDWRFARAYLSKDMQA